MRGIKLLATAALAANKSSRRPTDGPQNAVHTATSDELVFGRRKVLQQIICAGSVAAVGPKVAFGLDMDAFMNSELESDVKNCDPKKDPKCIPKLSSDEALCKYGQSGNARNEACKNVKKAGGELPSAKKEKSLGGAYAM